MNKYGFIQTPYRKVDREKGVVTNEIVWLTADEEDEYIVAQSNSKLNEKGGFAEPIVMGRHRGNNQEFPSDQSRLHGRVSKTSSCRCDSMYSFLGKR